MTKAIEAVFDGVTLHPNEPLDLPPNTHVRVTIESSTSNGEPASFLDTARGLALSVPPIGPGTSRGLPLWPQG
jgi:hypothetical protein